MFDLKHVYVYMIYLRGTIPYCIFLGGTIAHEAS